MNSDFKKQITVALFSLLSIVASISVVMTSEVLGQQQSATNVTNVTNATNATSTSSNLTQAAAAPGPLAALTQSDFDELTSNLNSARGAIRDNDFAGVVDDLGSAETELRTFMTQVGGENSTGGQQLSTVLDHINMAQDASSSSNDTLKAFQEINTADTDLLKIIQKLPAGGDEDD